MSRVFPRFHNLVTNLRLGPHGRAIRREHEQLLAQAADRHATSARLFGKTVGLEKTASHMETRGEDPTDVVTSSEATFALAEAFDAAGDELSEKATMLYEQLEQIIGHRHAQSL